MLTRRLAHDGRCVYCDRPFGTVVRYNGHDVALRLEREHLVPQASERVGVRQASNVLAACHICNRLKGGYVPESFADARLYVLTKLSDLQVVTVSEPAVIKARPARNCERCEEEFVSGHSGARFCSDKCRMAAWEDENPKVRLRASNTRPARPRRLPGGPLRTCYGKDCKVQFHTSTRKTKAKLFCSDYCRIRAWGEKHLTPIVASQTLCYCAGPPHSPKCRFLAYADRQQSLPFQPEVGPATTEEFCSCSGRPHTAKCRLRKYVERQARLPFHPEVGPQFQGETYAPELDQGRLGRQLDRVRWLVSDGKWWTLTELARGARGSEASVSARLRDLRKEGLTVDRERVKGGLWQYRVTR